MPKTKREKRIKKIAGRKRIKRAEPIKAWAVKSVKGWAIICHPRGGATYIGDADCNLSFSRSDPDNFTETVCVFEDKWAAKRHQVRARKMGVKVPQRIVPCEIILNPTQKEKDERIITKKELWEALGLKSFECIYPESTPEKIIIKNESKNLNEAILQEYKPPQVIIDRNSTANQDWNK